LVLIDGVARENVSRNTSFNVLTRIPRTLSSERCNSIVRRILEEGKGKPLIQLMGDFRRGTPTSQKKLASNQVQGTLTEATPGEITHLLPSQVQTNIVDFLDLMNASHPAITDPSNLVYSPVFEWFPPRVWIKPSGETSVPGIYVAGDIAGVSQGVIPAAAHGLWTGMRLADLL
jgi:uncharacterized FAD-dependent dehydrogenase